MEDQLIDKSALTRQNLSPSFRYAEIGDTVDLRKILSFARSWWPFHFKVVAGKPAQVKIRLHRESVDHFTAFLAQWCKRPEWPSGCKAGLLVEFALCASEQIAGFDISLRDRPGAFVLVAPVGPAGVREQ